MITSGYLLNFNRLFNLQGEDIEKCHKILVASAEQIQICHDRINHLVSRNDQPPLVIVLKKLKAEFARLMCDEGLVELESVLRKISTHRGRLSEEMFEDLSGICQNLLTEIAGLIEVKKLSS